MGRQIIELVQVLVDRIEKNGYQQRTREENAFDLNKRLTEAEGWVAHWKQARQEAHEAGELMRAEIETLRTQLADAKRAASDEFTERQVLTVEQQQDAAAWQQQLATVRAENETLRQRLADAEHPPAMAQQRDEIAYLRARLDEERSVSAGLREKLDATNTAWNLQCAGIERLHKFVGKVRLAMWPEDIKSALTELDAGTEPTPVVEPAHCPECERLRAFVGGIDNLLEQDRFDRRDIAELLIVLRSNSSATLTSSPTPVAEPLDAEGVQ